MPMGKGETALHSNDSYQAGMAHDDHIRQVWPVMTTPTGAWRVPGPRPVLGAHLVVLDGMDSVISIQGVHPGL